MLEPRIYRAAFLPAVLAVLLVMFSLESRPGPLAQGLAADVVFAGPSAVSTTRTIVEAAPDRRPGRPGDLRAARLVSDAFRASGFSVQQDRFTRGSDDLVNVVGRRAGSSRRQVVVVAARDAAGVPDAGTSAADTAALIELARVFEGRPSRKTLVLASVDGATLGEVGTQRLADGLGSPGLIDGVVVISGLGEPTRSRPAVIGWSGDTSSPGIGLARTAAESIRQELGRVSSTSGAFGQLARLAFPIGIGGQGPLIARGYDAVRISGTGELASAGTAGVEQIDPDRLGGLGRSALRTVTALDQASRPPEHGPKTYVTIVSQVMPGWAPSMLGLALIIPVLVAAIDAFARARRRGVAITPWLIWVAAGVVALLAGLVLARALGAIGAVVEPPDAPVTPALFPLETGSVLALVAIVVVTALGWVGLRLLARRREPGELDPASPGAAVGVAMVLALAALALWLLNPFAALFIVPAVHLWTLATLVDPGPPRKARLIMVALGLVAPLLLGTYVLLILSLDPLSGVWYLMLLVIGGHVSLITTLVWAVIGGAFGSVVAIARRARDGDEPPAGPALRGPATYAGPGSLGGTDSAL